VRDAADLSVKLQMGKGSSQFPVNLEERRFRLIETDQGTGIEAGDLPSDLRPD
jgi:hypothetical protein